MGEEDAEGRSRPIGSEPRARRGTDGRSSMRARAWIVAIWYADPEDYGIPALPDWRVLRDAGGMALAEKGAGDPFIRAERPMRVRR